MTPAECQTREHIRSEIDRVDRALVDLLAERFGYIHRMAEIKRDPGEARLDWRVNDVLAKVAAHAGKRGLDELLVQDLWARLIDWSIDREREDMMAARRQEDRRP